MYIGLFVLLYLLNSFFPISEADQERLFFEVVLKEKLLFHCTCARVANNSIFVFHIMQEGPLVEPICLA